MADYNAIFVSNVSRIMQERGLVQRDLARLAGLSNATLTAMLKKKDYNASLSSLEAISNALAVPLALMLQPVESDNWQLCIAYADSRKKAAEQSLLPGYTLIEAAVLTDAQAGEVDKWAKEIKRRLNALSS